MKPVDILANIQHTFSQHKAYNIHSAWKKQTIYKLQLYCITLSEGSYTKPEIQHDIVYSKTCSSKATSNANW
jgi:hypothetical protein